MSVLHVSNETSRTSSESQHNLSVLHVSNETSRTSSGSQHNALYYSALCCDPDYERLVSFETCRADKFWNKIDDNELCISLVINTLREYVFWRYIFSVFWINLLIYEVPRKQFAVTRVTGRDMTNYGSTATVDVCVGKWNMPRHKECGNVNIFLDFVFLNKVKNLYDIYIYICYTVTMFYPDNISVYNSQLALWNSRGMLHIVSVTVRSVILLGVLTFYSLLLTWCTNSLTFNSCTFCPHCIYVFCIYLRTNSDLCHLQHKRIGFYNWDGKCLLRGTNWVFK